MIVKDAERRFNIAVPARAIGVTQNSFDNSAVGRRPFLDRCDKPAAPISLERPRLVARAVVAERRKGIPPSRDGAQARYRARTDQSQRDPGRSRSCRSPAAA